MKNNGPKILAIDDNQDNLISLKALIRGPFPQAEIVTAQSGRQGLDIAAESSPDIILLDIVMPEMDGFEVCRRLKADARLSEIPVVFITAIKGDKDSRIKALEVGGDAFLAKPVDESELTAQIRAMLKIRKAAMERLDEKKWLQKQVEERTAELKRTHIATLNLLEDLQMENRRRKESEEALRESESRFRAMFENMAAASCIDEIIYENGRAVDYRLLDVNPAYERVTEISREEAAGALASELYGMGKAPFLDIFDRVAGTGEPAEFEAYFEPIRKFLYMTVGCPKRGFFSTVFTDITDRKLAEEVLRESETRKRSYFEQAPYGIFITNTKGEYAEVNPKACELTGYSEKELIKKSISDLVIAEDLEIGLKHFEKVQKTGNAYGELRYRTKAGTLRWWSVAATKLSDDLLLGFCADITDRKQAEELLRQSEEKYRLLAGNSVDVIWQMDLRLRFTYVTPSIYAMTGHTPEEWIGTGLSRHATFREFMQMGRKAVTAIRNYKTFNHITFEAVMLKKDGSSFPVEISARLIFNKKGLPSGLQGTTRDITLRKQAEESLREHQDLLTAIYRNAPLVIMVVDSERRIQQINGFASQFADRNTEEMLGLRGGEALRCLHALDDPQGCGAGEYCRQCTIRNTVLNTLKTGETHLQVEASFLFKKDDHEIQEMTFLLSTTPIMVKGNRMALVTLNDITGRKEAEVIQARLQEQLQQAQKLESIGRLAGGVAHDFNNMLVGILGHAEIAMEKVDSDSSIYADLEVIQSAAMRSADLTRQLLAFARKQTVAPKVIDLNRTVTGMSKMLKRLIGEDIDMVWVPGEEVWPVKIDPGQIDQILANLCVNARDAIGGIGRVTIETGNIVLDEHYCKDNYEAVPGEYVVLAVSDNGCGIDDETLSHLFEPFFTTKEAGKGTGLGLSTVYGVVKQNKGSINVYSEPGIGTTFKIYLPRHMDKAVPIPVKRPDKQWKQSHETILLAEDEPMILKMITTMLERSGYTVLAAGTPGEAIRLANEHAGEIHLLMSDVVMPEMNGRDLAKNILSLYPDIKCLFMSGYTANVIAHHGVLDEGVNFIQKPFSMGDLTTKVRQVLERNQGK